MHFSIVLHKSREVVYSTRSYKGSIPRSGEFIQWEAKMYKVINVFYNLDLGNYATVFVEPY